MTGAAGEFGQAMRHRLRGFSEIPWLSVIADRCAAS
jgi:hypothetical protein